MERRFLDRRVLVGYVRRRGRQNAILLVVSGLLAFAVVFAGAFRDSAERAAADSLRADLGHRAFVIQTGEPHAAAVLEHLPEAAPVEDRVGDLLAGDLSASVLARTTTDSSLKLGIVVAGRRPTTAGEVLISQPLATALGVSIGDEVQLRLDGERSAGMVVGYSIDPADGSNTVVLRLVDKGSELTANRWLTDYDPYSIADLRPFLDSRVATFQSTESVLEAVRSNPPQFMSALRLMPEGAGLLLAVVLSSVLAASGRQWMRDVGALTSAGMSPGSAWTHILSVTAALAVVGEIVGAVLAYLVVSAASVPLSGWIAQRWVHVVVPWTAPLVVVALTVVTALVMPRFLRSVPAAMTRLYRPQGRRRWITHVARTAVVLGALMWTILVFRISTSSPEDDGGSGAVILSAVVIVATAPFVLAPLLCRALPRATSSLVRNLQNTMLPITSAASVVILLCTIYVSQTVYDANLGERLDSPLLPPGSFVVSEVPNSVLPTLTGLYAEHGGSEVSSYGLPDEGTSRLRVTSVSLVTCMSEQSVSDPDAVPDRCWPQATASPINTVALGPPGSTVRADPGLISGGSVGLLLFTGSDGKAEHLESIVAKPDSTLGGLLPGLVIPRDGKLAAEFALVPGGKSQLVLLDFSTLEPRQRFVVRAAVTRIAAGAETADGTNPTAYDRLRTAAYIVGVLGAVLGATVLLLGGAATVLASGIARRAVVDIGASRSARWRIFLIWTALPALAVAFTVPIAFQTASLFGQRNEAQYGLMWILPGIAGLLASLTIGRAMLSVPPDARD
jgi:hypothetical protein